MPSPPYTPYNNSPPAQGDMQQFPPSTVAYEPNDSPYSVGALPLNSYKMRRSLSPSETSSDGCQYGNTSPPYSATSVPQTLPLVGGVATTPQQSQTPTGFQPQPGPFGYVAPNSFVPSASAVGSTTPPQVAAMSVGTPSPSVEMPATFYTHGSAVTFQAVGGFGDPAVHGLTTTDVHFVGDTQALGSNYSIRSVPLAGQSRVRQTVINDARVRYSGVMPSGHFMHASNGRPHGEREATESISQWSQWLKSGAPAGSAPPVY